MTKTLSIIIFTTHNVATKRAIIIKKICRAPPQLLFRTPEQRTTDSQTVKTESISTPYIERKHTFDR